MYKALIFDFFDVIYTDCFAAWLKKYNYKKEGEFAEASGLIDIGSIDSKGFCERLSSASGVSTNDIESQLESFAKLDTAIVEFIKNLHNHYKIGLLSNAGSDYLRSLLQKHDLEVLFDKIIISSEVGIPKPDPAVFQLMLKKLAVEPGSVIFIDDHKNNVESAESLGIQGVWYRNI